MFEFLKGNTFHPVTFHFGEENQKPLADAAAVRSSPARNYSIHQTHHKNGFFFKYKPILLKHSFVKKKKKKKKKKIYF